MAPVKPIKLPLVSPDVEALLLWRDPKRSGLVLGGVVAVFILSCLPSARNFPALIILCYLVTIVTATMLIWAQLGAVVSKSGPPVPPVLLNGLSDAEIRKYAEAALPTINAVLATLGVLASGKDLRLSILVITSSYTAARVFARISPFTMVFIASILLFSLPKVYELKQDEINKVVATVRAKLEELYEKVNEAVISKIPKAKKDAAAAAAKVVEEVASKVE